MSGHIFVSYSRTDEVYVSALVAYLGSAGLHVWHDSGIDYGDQWVSVIQSHIDTCSAFVVVMSPTAENSKWVLREINRAEDRRKPILPLLLAGEPFFRLSELHYDDVRTGHLPDQRFLHRLARLLATPAAPATVRTDGVYVSDPTKVPGTPWLRSYVRFYAGGVVVYRTSAEDPNTVMSSLESGGALRSTYQVAGSAVGFALPRPDGGFHQYRGVVADAGRELRLSWLTVEGGLSPGRFFQLRAAP